MLELKTRKELAGEATKLAHSHHLVRYHSLTFIPVDYVSGKPANPLDPDRTIWLPLDQHKIRALAAEQFDTMFSSDAELRSFDFMVAQEAEQIDDTATCLLVRTPDGLRELNDQGQLVPPTGEFRPNTLVPMLNTDPDEKARVFAVVSGWLDSDTEAESLLTHLATCLAPGWSAVKYILLLGEGRNGKSLCLKMIEHLFGADNVSHVTRQHMSEQNPVVLSMTGKLVNLVYDGLFEMVKDSGPEKSLIAGEPVAIRRLYESAPTMVQTTALFIEGLNREPKTRDKSLALQKRLVRFQFPNIYELNHRFERQMLGEPSLGAFLSLLVDRYVLEDEVAERLAPTAKSVMLGLEAMHSNNLGLQFLAYLEDTDTVGARSIVGQPMSELVAAYQSWRVKEGDISTLSDPDVQALFSTLVNVERRSQRVNGKPRKVKIVTMLRAEARAYIEALKGEEDDASIIEAVVGD